MRVSFVLLLFLAVACNKEVATAPPAAERQVAVQQSNFTPNNVLIREGGTVRFVFEGTAHSVIFEQVPGRPENIETIANTVEERVFALEGNYPFWCRDHQNMTGEVRVERVEETPEGGE
jgi:plastocyanin